MFKKIIFALIIAIAVVIGIGFWFYQIKEDQTCVLSGGSIKTSMCCNLTSNFPNSCSIGACGCSPANSHQVKTCECGEGKCFNGHVCVPLYLIIKNYQVETPILKTVFTAVFL